MHSDKFSDFKFLRNVRILKRILHTTLSITLLFAINSLFAKYYKRIDLTQQGTYSLSAETKAHLRTLKSETHIYVLFPKDSNQAEIEQILSHIRHLLRSYESDGVQNGERLLKIEYIDPFRQRAKAQTLFDKYKVNEENILLVTQGERSEVIRQADLYEVSNNQITGFKGEIALTSAIINVNTESTDTLYFVLGHGEMHSYDNDPNNGISSLRAFLENRNFQTDNLSLLESKKIPEDASMLIIASPQGKFLAPEVDLLRRYMSEQNGRMMLFVDPGASHGLDDLLMDWGILSENKFIYEPNTSMTSNANNFIINQFAKHPINDLLIDYNLNVVLGQPRPVIKDPLAENNKRLAVIELMGTSPSSWVERTPLTADFSIEYNPKTDSKGPISIAAISNLSQSSSLDINIPSGRMAVFGDSKFINNKHFQIFGNQILFNNTLNWILDRMHMLKIPTREIASYQITISQTSSRQLLVLYSLLPIFIALWGFLILYFRKR